MDFQNKAKEELDYIFDAIESYDQYEVDLLQGIIYIDADFGQYVINIHQTMQELWVSSPKSGAHHFKLTDNNLWKSSKNQELHNLLMEELAIQL